MLHPSSTIAAILLLVAVLLGAACSQKSEPANQPGAGVPPDSVLIELATDGSSSALELLRQGHVVEARGSAMGSFVTAVDSIKGGGGYFWVYSVNDTMPQSAADKCVPGRGDTVRWHFRTAPR